MGQIIKTGEYTQSTVRVLETIDDRFVVFEFCAGDPDLAVELVLRPEQFHEFCARHCCRIVDAAEAQALDRERLKWRYGKDATVL